MFHPKNLYSSVKPMFYICRILGLAPFKLADQHFQKSFIFLTWNVVVMTSMFVYSIIYLHERTIYSTSLITAVPDIVNSYLCPISMFFDILFQGIFSSKILGILSSLNIFDKDIQNYFHINLTKEYKRSKIYLLIGLLIITMHISLSYAFVGVLSKNAPIMTFMQSWILYSLPMTVNYFTGFQCFVVVLFLKQRFHWLNDKLVRVSENLSEKDLHANYVDLTRTKVDEEIKFRKLLSNSDKKEQMFYKNSPILERIRANHYQLCIISNDINTAYSMQILLLVFKNFITIITGLFYCGRNLMYAGYITVEYLLYTVVQLSLAIVQIVGLTIACSRTAEEAQKTGSLVHKTRAFHGQSKKELKLQVTFFSLQLLHQKVEFTACKIFVVDETLLLTIVGAVSTYLVIVIQFQMGDIRNSTDNS